MAWQTGADALSVLTEDSPLLNEVIKSYVSSPSSKPSGADDSSNHGQLLRLAMASLDAFLQTNVTGPVLPDAFVARMDKRFTDAQGASPDLALLRRQSLDYLEVDGVSPYAYMPYPELFALARYILTTALADAPSIVEAQSSADSRPGVKYSLPWARLRVDTWHYKLLTQPSLGHGSNFTKSSQWSDVPSLATKISSGIAVVSNQILGTEGGDEVWAGGDDDSKPQWSADDQALFLVEAANYYILLGRNDLTRDLIDKATKATGLQYALSGALGKRTRYQEKSTSQMVVLAKSGGASSNDEAKGSKDDTKPDALDLNDDTLLENIHFTKEQTADNKAADILPAALADLSPDDQPQLSPLDQIILLTEATLKDAFSPVDTLTSEEIMPYAVRVLADKSTNWQIYTLALLVRSRIELHRSRTVDRGVLQLQAVADQVLADTAAAEKEAKELKEAAAAADVPAIQVTGDADQAKPVEDKPTSFLPAPKASESAPAHVRLQYIHALSTPPRWHLESELAYAWVSVGSLASALEIFKRLRLWAEVALCLASRAAIEDEDGRGSGGEEKARGIIRWRLFHHTGTAEATPGADPDDDLSSSDVTQLRGDDFAGPERTPAPPNAARLWCILGDIESQPSHYERAWEVSNQRYARAQRSLAEHYVQQRDWPRARDAYRLATGVNRLNSDMWSRLGDINLGLADFEDAAESYSRAISCATDTGGGEGAKTWSNLGSALWSLYLEVAKEAKTTGAKPKDMGALKLDDEEEGDEDDVALTTISRDDPARLLSQSLAAYKRGASIAHDNWRIWDNVLTLSARVQPPAVADMVLATRHVLRIRPTEDAVDPAVLSALVQDVVLSKTPAGGPDADGNVDKILPRGSPERLVVRLVEETVVPLITRRSDLWALVSRMRAWMRDYAGAIDAAERAWRAAMGSASGGLSAASASGSGGADGPDWTSDRAAWDVVVDRTDELASVLENWGPDVDTIGPKWKGRVRSAVRSVMGRGKEAWEGSEGWSRLQAIMDGLKAQ